MWNLSGDFTDGKISNHELRLPNSSKTMGMDQEQIPTGKFENVFGTPLNF
jgi:hypothetical protein